MSNDPTNTPTNLIVGIDLGTTNSLVALFDQATPRALGPDPEGTIVPSVVRYEHAEGNWSTSVGQDARDHQVAHPRRTVSSVKRLMGRSIQDAAPDAAYLGYAIEPGERGTVRAAIEHDDQRLSLTPEEVSAEILAELKRLAERDLAQPISKAVVTVPAYFDDAQRQATRDAGRLAGLEVVRIVNEPTAAALAYGIGTHATKEPSTIAVFDLGGGTFDISILRLTPSDDANPTDFFQVIATAGDTHLGGDDVDQQLVSLFANEIAQEMGLDIADIAAFPPETRRALVSFAEQVKIRLSEHDSAELRIQINESTTYERTVTRDELEAIITPWADRAIRACEKALRDAQRASGGPVTIDSVVMVGGSTRIPLVRRRVKEFFDVEPYVALDPDRVVAMGAAVQAAVLSGAATGALLLDVIPLSLGIETRGGAVAKLIVRNSSVPARATEMFSTSADSQTSIAINVVQGEREMAEDCRSLGRFELSGLPPMPAGIPQLEVEFLVDANGVLSVHAHERRSGKRAELQVVPSHGLTREEVDRIEADSYTHARDDMTRHRIVDLIENARLDIKWITEKLTAHEPKLEPDYAKDLHAKLNEVQGLIDKAQADWRSVDPDTFHHSKEALAHTSIRLQEVAIAESLKD